MPARRLQLKELFLAVNRPNHRLPDITLAGSWPIAQRLLLKGAGGVHGDVKRLVMLPQFGSQIPVATNVPA